MGDKLFEAFGVEQNVGIAIAAAMVLAAQILLPRERRRAALLPAALLVGHVVVLAAEPWATEALREPVHLFALFLLLTSVARSGFLAIMYGLLLPRLHAPLPKIIQDIVQALIYVGVLMITLRAAGVEPASLLTTSALLTAVIGLSLQDTLGNMFAGLAIQAQRPFDAGDWIQFDDDPNHVGRIIEMNWRAVRLRTLGDVEITVPNSTIADAPIRNYSKPAPLVRQSVHVVAPYATPPHVVRQAIVRAIEDVNGLDRHTPPSVVAQDFSERGVLYWVRYHITNFDNREAIAGEVRSRIWYALHREGVSIPAPRRDVSLHEASPEAVEKAQARETEARQQAISNVDFLRVLPPRSHQLLAASSREKLFASGELIIRTGEEGEELFIVQEGQVEILVGDEDHRAVVATLGPGDFFGEMSVMTGEKRRATVRASSDVRLLVVDKTAVKAVLESSSALLESLSRVLAERELKLEKEVHRLDSDRPPRQSMEERTGQLLHRIRRFFSL